MTEPGNVNLDEYYAKMEAIWASSYPSSTAIDEFESFYKELGINRTTSEIVAELMANVSLERGRLLEFGCDNGIMLNFFRDYGFKLYGVDINAASINQGRTLYPDFNLQINTGLTIPFEDDSFDVILVSGVLKHIRYQDQPQLFDEFERVSRYVLVFEKMEREAREERFGDFTFYHADYSQELSNRFNMVHEIKKQSYLFGLYRIKN